MKDGSALYSRRSLVSCGGLSAVAP
jgi:hypothetical protein